MCEKMSVIFSIHALFLEELIIHTKKLFIHLLLAKICL